MGKKVRTLSSFFFQAKVEVSNFVNVLECGLHLVDVEVVLASVTSEVVEDLVLFFFGDPPLLVSASHSSPAFLLAKEVVLVSINLVEDLLNREIFRELIRDRRAINDCHWFSGLAGLEAFIQGECFLDPGIE